MIEYYMGGQQSRLIGNRQYDSLGKSIDNIYQMFKQSNEVVLMDLKSKNPSLAIPKIKNIESVVEQLLQPFRQNQKYNWSQHIYCRFKKNFTANFEPLWAASREKFYELLLTNCKVNVNQVIDKSAEGWSYQNAFYSIAAEHIEQKMADTFIGDINEEEFKRGLRNLSMLGQENGMKLNHLDPSEALPSSIDEIMSKKSSQITGNNNKEHEYPMIKRREKIGKFRVNSSSLILPQTLFIHKMSLASQDEIYDLLKFYRQFSDTLQQIICSNNLISCPIKNFIVCLEDKIGLKRIKTDSIKKSELLGNGEETRKARKTRQTNNNIILYEIRAFLTAYTEFVWMFLQLHMMEESNLGKIVQSDVLFGIIFKHLWTYVDWISDRGYEFQEAQLEDYFEKKSTYHACKIPEEKLKQYISLLQQLRGQKHPQQYLKKLIIFYREVSKECQNADDLLCLYEEVMRHCASEKGIRDLRLFRMRNIIQKLLRIEDSSLSGGEITYSWTTWCIMIELLKEKVNYKYGMLIISQKASGEVLKPKESELSWQDKKAYSDRQSFHSEKEKQNQRENFYGCFSKEQNNNE